MELPLLERTQAGDAAFCLTTAIETAEGPMASLCGVGSSLTLPPPPGPGEQYRFHFDMTKCIGCKCCIVACNEQNGNPADILWRRVGEIEGGVYPDTLRHYLSMGCNHCLEPTCMTGCPVDAYSKDPVTGIVRHSADACIGCQYCTWNCSYGVPQYNPERGVVGKCDMCYGRLTQGQQPACAFACPEDAIRIETVRAAEWREEYRSGANSPGLPSADDSLSTTRITLPKRMPRDVRKVDQYRLRPEQPHWPLIVMTVLTQLSAGAFTSIWLLEIFSARIHRSAALVAMFAAVLALCASTLHLGRPVHAMRALKMWRRSWLSREVLMFTLFAAAAAAYSLTLWLGLSESVLSGGVTALFGFAGVYASARLYLVPGRPAWNSPFTVAEFLFTATLLGAAGATILNDASSFTRSATAIAGLGTLLVAGFKMFWLGRSNIHELRGAFRLLTTVLSGRLLWRIVASITGLILLQFAHNRWTAIPAACALIAGEFLGRYLFFVSVVPTNMATGYLSTEAA
jgi:formate dehydrogenase iron-sulfur subunit